MERSEVSQHEVAFYKAALAAGKDWKTAKELAEASGIAHRTGRAFALKFVLLGLFDQAEVWPAHRYRWSSVASKRNRSYLQRLDLAAAVFSSDNQKTEA